MNARVAWTCSQIQYRIKPEELYILSFEKARGQS